MGRTGIIYVIKNKCNDKVYIGQTTQCVEDRFKQHLKPSQRKRARYKLYRAIDKYGSDNFYYEVLEKDVPYDKLDEREIYYIEKFDSFKNGYNSTHGGDTKSIYKIEDIEGIVAKLRSGGMVKNIAEDYDVNVYTINRTLRAYGINKPRDVKGKTVREDLRTLPREDISKLYKQGFSHKQIADTLKINERSVSRVVKELGIGKRKMIDYASLDIDAILADFDKVAAGEIMQKEVLKKYGLNQHSIKIIKRMKNIQ